MAELRGVDLTTHLEAIVSEFSARESIYGYPKRKMFLGFPGYDFSVRFHDREAATPLGPAAGPHTQMAQNIVLSFLGGGRIMELKTVQILDQLDIPRPCIDIRNVGYNIEWSQELRLEDSYREYVTAWVLLRLIEEMELLGIPKGDPFYRTIFDISVGYDLEGIASPRMHRWLEGMKDAGAAIDALLDSLPAKFAHLKAVDIDPHISSSVTLSTFHGCPREEIESIVQHLIREHRFHVIVKMNPTVLGYDFVEHMLHEELGYQEIILDPEAFEKDLQFDDGVAMMKRLQTFAADYGVTVGAKFTNTLVVKNHDRIFKDEVMYLSGAPLHVLAMHAMHRFRQAMGPEFPVSFSAGITKHNVADALACNMVPVTVCTDLLKTGGYTRMFDYMRHLQKAMEQLDCRTLPEFIKRRAGVESLAEAGMINAGRYVPGLHRDPRYKKEMNRKEPPKIDSHLTLFDCITCDKCLPVCPNAANFSITTGQLEWTTLDLQVRNGQAKPVPGEPFVLKKERQIANLADFCNDCGNCDTYCPEYGGPYIEKPRFFLSEASYRDFSHLDGFYFEPPLALHGRIGGEEHRLVFDVDRGEYRWQRDGVEVVLDRDNRLVRASVQSPADSSVRISLKSYYIMRVLLDGLLNDPGGYAAVMVRIGTKK